MASRFAYTTRWLATCAVACCAVASPTSANAAPTAPAAPTATSSATIDKKSQYLVAKQADREAPTRRHKRITARASARPINIHNLWTNEWLVVDVPRRGAIQLPAARVVRTFLRCHFTEEEFPALDLRPFQLALDAAQHFKKNRIDVISGYRSPKYNLMLRKKGREVARDSQHTKGSAIDIRLPDVAPRALARWVRRKKLGGVGIYRSSGFVHVDSGPLRTWSGR